MTRYLVAASLAALAALAAIASPAAAQSLTLTNLKGPVSRACKVPQAKSIAELWRQLNACNAAHDGHAPPPATGDILAPAPDLDFGFGLEKGTIPAWGTGGLPGAYDEFEGAFRFVCGGDGPLSYDDPVLYPGRIGASHLHQVFGNKTFSAFLTREALAANAASNCNAAPFSHNRSSYWQPALVHDDGSVIQPDLIGVYYKRKTSASPFCTPGADWFVGRCEGIPNGIRVIFGWNPAAPNAKVVGAWFYCTGVDGHFPDLEAVFAAGCKAGADLVANTAAPNCWDGKRLDSADHRSHLTYIFADPQTGKGQCPPTYPVFIPQEENKAIYRVTADMVDANGRPKIRLSSDVMKPGAKRGETLHADYFEAWSAVGKKAWLEGCIEKALSCSGGDLGNGLMLEGAREPVYGWLNPNPRQAAPARP